jgi:hypothetical protein
MATPKGRALRSGSQSDIILTEIKNLKCSIETSKKEVIETLRKDIESLRLTVNSLTDRIVHLEQQNKDLNEKLQDFSHSSETLADSIIEECNQRRRRECNIIVFGISESKTDSPEAAEAADRKELDGILNEIDVTDVKVKELRRIGRPGGKRFLKVKFESLDQKWRVLKKTSNLRKCPRFSSVFVSQDLTPLQQLQRKERLKELRERQNAGEDVVLYRNTVIKRESIKKSTNRGSSRILNA